MSFESTNTGSDESRGFLNGCWNKFHFLITPRRTSFSYRTSHSSPSLSRLLLVLSFSSLKFKQTIIMITCITLIVIITSSSSWSSSWPLRPPPQPHHHKVEVHITTMLLYALIPFKCPQTNHMYAIVRGEYCQPTSISVPHALLLHMTQSPCCLHSWMIRDKGFALMTIAIIIICNPH